MAKLAPARSCCGCVSLLFGVELICLINLLVQVGFIFAIRSTDVLNVIGFRITPVTQLLWGTWFLVGIPVVIGGGVGAVFRVESQLRRYCYYLSITWITWLLLLLGSLVGGEVCRTILSADLRRLGDSLVCGFSDTLVLLWLLLLVFVGAYCSYIVWSAKEQVAQSFFPEMQERLRQIQSKEEAAALGMPIVGSALQAFGRQGKGGGEQVQQMSEDRFAARVVALQRVGQEGGGDTNLLQKALLQEEREGPVLV